MKVFLDVDPQLAESCQSAGRSVDGLEWASESRNGVAVITDKISSPSGNNPTLFLGALSELADFSLNLDELEGQLSVGSRRRFDPSVQSLFDGHREGQLGELGVLRLHRWLGGPMLLEKRIYWFISIWLCGFTEKCPRRFMRCRVNPNRSCKFIWDFRKTGWLFWIVLGGFQKAGITIRFILLETVARPIRMIIEMCHCSTPEAIREL